MGRPGIGVLDIPRRAVAIPLVIAVAACGLLPVGQAGRTGHCGRFPFGPSLAIHTDSVHGPVPDGLAAAFQFANAGVHLHSGAPCR